MFFPSPAVKWYSHYTSAGARRTDAAAHNLRGKHHHLVVFISGSASRHPRHLREDTRAVVLFLRLLPLSLYSLVLSSRPQPQREHRRHDRRFTFTRE